MQLHRRCLIRQANASHLPTLTSSISLPLIAFDSQLTHRPTPIDSQHRTSLTTRSRLTSHIFFAPTPNANVKTKTKMQMSNHNLKNHIHTIYPLRDVHSVFAALRHSFTPRYARPGLCKLGSTVPDQSLCSISRSGPSIY
jgi:hypothetical protein